MRDLKGKNTEEFTFFFFDSAPFWIQEIYTGTCFSSENTHLSWEKGREVGLKKPCMFLVRMLLCSSLPDVLILKLLEFVFKKTFNNFGPRRSKAFFS